MIVISGDLLNPTAIPESLPAKDGYDEEGNRKSQCNQRTTLRRLPSVGEILFRAPRVAETAREISWGCAA
jgi:hypothetical protein